MPGPIAATLYTDPGCPWAYSALPALRVLQWRYGAQLDWRLVVIGLAETSEQYTARGYTTVDRAIGWTRFRDRFGMPFQLTPKARVSATARACRAIVTARLLSPGSEWAVLRALQLANFTRPLLLDDDEALRGVLEEVDGVAPLLERFPEGLTTQEVAALLVRGNDAPDRTAAERLLIRAVAEGVATRVPAGDDAVWRPVPA